MGGFDGSLPLPLLKLLLPSLTAAADRPPLCRRPLTMRRANIMDLSDTILQSIKDCLVDRRDL